MKIKSENNISSILFYGAFCDKHHKITTGQTVVSSIIIKELEKSYSVYKVNIADRTTASRGSLSFTILRTLHFLGLFLKLFLLLSFKKVDVVYYQLVYSKIGIIRDHIAIRILALFNKPVCGHALGITKIEEIISSSAQLKRMCNWNYAHINRIIVEGEEMKSNFKVFPNAETKVAVIPNGLNEEFPENKEPKRYDITKPFKVLYLSNLIFSKGYYDVLRAIDILVNKDHLDVECMFAGRFYRTLEAEDNDDNFYGKEAFDFYLVEHNLINRVKYKIGLYGEEKKDAFLESNVFVLPTYYSGEGQPMAILEAMSYGCVPLVTPHGHIPIMVNEENGCIVEPKSPGSIALRIKELINDSELYTKKSANSLNDFKAKFKGDVFSNKIKNEIINVFESII